MDGKDACLALLRDMVITRTREALVERAVLVVIPIYNADGHERFGPYNRVNQNGPESGGWRTQARNLNLNRDYMKADAPETRALLRLWNRWLPDLFVDDHVTDGADYQYDTTYGLDMGPDVPPALAEARRRRWGLAILSNTDRDLIDASMVAIGIAFHPVVVASEIGSYKPGRRHWDAFREATGADQANHVHVAQSLYHDIEPASALGIRCIWVNRLGEPDDGRPARTIPDLTRLPETLDGLVPP